MNFFDWLRGRQAQTPRTVPSGYDPSAPGADVFDPALKHLPTALRKGDPSFATDADRLLWTRQRADALTAIVARIGASTLRTQLVVRGGITLGAWFPAQARPAKDADFVVVPPTLAVKSEQGQALIAQIAAVLREPFETPDWRVDGEQLGVDSIWEYERAEGRRFQLAFTTSSGPRSSVQLDVVFGETLHQAPESLPLKSISLTCPHGETPYRSSPSTILAATMQESLAWKVLWLCTDMWPQGKDLYDAVLLAEALSEDAIESARELITEVIASAAKSYGGPPEARVVPDWRESLRTDLLREHVAFEWKHLGNDSPHLAHLKADELSARLFKALRV